MTRLLESLLRLLDWPSRPSVVWGETLVISLLVIALGLLQQPVDPLGLQAPFPWGWFAPALLALRHGALSALASALVLVLAQAWLAPESWADARLNLHLLGGLSLTLLLSQFAGLWHNRLLRKAEQLAFAQEQLRALTREHFQLRISHERLEQELVLRPGSLNDAVAALDATLRESAEPGPLPQAQRLLHLLAEYCRLDAAAIHLLDADGTPLATPVAHIGQVPAPQRHDPLLQQALASGQLAHMAEGDDHAASEWLVAAVLHGAEGSHGILLVRDMPFLALDPENLQTLNLILLAYTDLVERERIVAPLLAQVPSCPAGFALTLHRVWRAHQRAGVESHLMTLEAPRRPELTLWFDTVAANQRMLDAYWPDSTPHTLRLHILLPLGSRLQADGLLERLQQTWPATSSASLNGARLLTHIRAVDQAPAALLAQLHERGAA